MNKKNVWFLAIIIPIVLVIGGVIVGLHIAKNRESEEDVIDGGVVKNGRLKGYSETIKSEDIVYFNYSSYYFSGLCEKKNKELHIKVSGFINNDINKSFKKEFIVKNDSFLDKLEAIIKKYNISKNNGYEYEIAGLSPEYGDSISVEYKSGEKIWKTDNQENTISEEAFKEIYDAFYDLSKETGNDFTK